jgi:hypothetical protein
MDGHAGVDACDSDYSEFDDALSVDSYNENEFEEDFAQDGSCIERSLNDLKRGESLSSNKTINTRSFDTSSIFLPGNNSTVTSNEASQNAKSSTNAQTDNCAFGHGASKYKTLLAFISGATIRNNLQEDMEKSDFSEEGTAHSDSSEDCILEEWEWSELGFSSNFNRGSIPTMQGVADRISRENHITLDRIQYIAYEVICSSFLLNLIRDSLESQSSMASGFTDSHEDLRDERTTFIKQKVEQKLKDLGAKEQLLMFVTGPAGAGKSTAIDVAQQFCFQFCKSMDILWGDKTFLFTAITGCAAALFGGVTLHSAAYLNSKSKNISPGMLQNWEQVQMLIIDEISFSTCDQMEKLNSRLNMIRRRLCSGGKGLSPNMIFGGYSIIFCGDFRQIPPVKARDSQLLYSNSSLWENSINVAIILNNSHRFKDDPEYGRILKRMWDGSFTKEDCNVINERLISQQVQLPEIQHDADIAYACWKNCERVTIHASIFQSHIKDFPSVDSSESPPEHTVVIEAEIRKAPKRRISKKRFSEDTPLPARLTTELQNKIYAKCGDSDMKDQQKNIDPALKLYVGAHCMIIDNDDISKGRANGTLCRVIGVKRKTDTPLNWKNYDGKKVYTINVTDVDYVEFEHFPKKVEQIKIEQQISSLENDLLNDPMNEEKKVQLHGFQIRLRQIVSSRRFQLKPKRYYCTFYRSDIDPPDKGVRLSKVSKRGEHKQKVIMIQLPINLNEATTAHKLQGITKKELIVHNWNYSHGWVYTVLSRVRTRDGLFLNKPLMYKPDAFKLPPALIAFQNRMQSKIPEKANI